MKDLKRFAEELRNAPFVSFIQELLQGKKSTKSLLELSYVKDCVRDMKESKQDWQIGQMQEQIRELNSKHDRELKHCNREIRELNLKHGQEIGKMQEDIRNHDQEIRDIKQEHEKEKQGLEDQLKQKESKIHHLEHRVRMITNELGDMIPDFLQGESAAQ